MRAYLLTPILALAASFAVAEPVTISVHYSYPDLVRPVHDQIAKKLMTDNPDIKVEFKAATPDYSAGMQTLLRGAVTGDMPDITFPGINWQRVGSIVALPSRSTVWWPKRPTGPAKATRKR